MKKLLLILLCLPMIGFGQQSHNVVEYSKNYYGVSLENKLSRIYDYSFSIDSMITLNRIPNDGNIETYREQYGLVNFSYVDSYSQNDSISLTLFCDSCCKCLNEYDEITGFRIDPPYKKKKQITRKENDFKNIYKNDLQNKNEEFIITYTKLNTDNYVISGKTGNTIYYQKSIYREDGIIITAELEYPSALKEIGNNMASLLYKSLKFNYGN